MRKIALLVTLALMAVPATALAADSPSSSDQASAAKLCSAQRTAMGAAAFTALYGTNGSAANAYGKCVSKLAKGQEQNRLNAAKQCTAEQSDSSFAANHGGKSFDQLYGSGKNGKNAFGKCVSTKAQAATEAQQQATVNAAKACKAERGADAAAFKTKYGTGKTKANAFGKCVAAKAKTQ